MNEIRPNNARVIDAAFRAILALDWPRLESLRRAYPHLLFDYAAPLVVSERWSFKGAPGVLTWNSEGSAFVVEAGGEQVARWIGFDIAVKEDFGPVTWLGTCRLPSGSWAAQFLVWENEDAIAA